MRFGTLLTVCCLALAASAAPADEPRPAGPPADSASLEKKVADLERQLAALRKEVQDLRKQLQDVSAANAGKAKSVVWGKTADGLQAGLALRPGDKNTCQVGDAVRFVVKVRNAGDRAIEMRYLAVEADSRVGPSVLDDDGKRPPLSGPVHLSVGGRAISKLALAAGQEVEFALPEMTFGPAGESRVQEKTAVQAGPGKYRVSYHVYYLNADDTGAFITTGELEVEATQPPRKQR
jgi:hypothetical protein